MSSLLLAESGSTKTDWCLLRRGKKPVHFRTTGINPNLQSEEDLYQRLKSEINWHSDYPAPDRIHFYGAGVSSDQGKNLIGNVLRSLFGTEGIEVESDMMAAARALCGTEKGIACILGTGSNSCYYDGQKISRQQASLGFIAGDEGSGNHMGKLVLQYYAYKTFEPRLCTAFEEIAGGSLPHIIRKLYKEPFPNRYLASFVLLLAQNRGHYMVENILEDCLRTFFINHILSYPERVEHPIHFTGSVSWEFRDVIAKMCRQHELQVGTISKSPLEGLIQYHLQLL